MFLNHTEVFRSLSYVMPYCLFQVLKGGKNMNCLKNQGKTYCVTKIEEFEVLRKIMFNVSDKDDKIFFFEAFFYIKHCSHYTLVTENANFNTLNS